MLPQSEDQQRRCSGLVITPIANRFGRINILRNSAE